MIKRTVVKTTPITIPQLVSICEHMATLDRQDSLKYGKSVGITKHNVDAIRQMLGYSDFGKCKRLSLEERDQIADEYRDEEISMSAIAKRHGIRTNAVRCILDARGVTIYNPLAWTKRQELYLKAEIKKGTPTSKIADCIGKEERCIIEKLKRINRDEVIISGCRDKLPLEDIAAKANTKASKVSNIIKRMKKQGIIKEENP